MFRTHFPLDGKRAPVQRELDALFAAADRFELRQRSGSGRDGAILIAGSGDDLLALHQALRIREDPTSGFHCMCHGDLGLILKKGGNTEAVLGLHHGVGIRHEGWDSDAELLTPRDFAAFLDARGMPGQLAAFDAAEAAQHQHLRARDAWAAGAPPCLRGFAKTLSPNAPSPVQSALDGPVAILLSSEKGNAHAAREALLRWSGAHMSRWDEYPSYESVPTDMLARLDFDRAIAEHLMSPAAVEPTILLGLARYIALRGLSVAGTESLARGLDDATREKMLQLAAPYDVHDRLPRSLDKQSLTLQVPHGATLEHVFEEDHYYGLCCDGKRFYGVDGKHIVRFDPGERRPKRICEVARDARIRLAAHGQRIVVAEDARIYRLTPEGARQDLLTLPKPPDDLYAFPDHIVWVTNSDPQNPAGRTYGVQGRVWDGDDAPIRSLLPPDPNPPYGICFEDGRFYILQRRKKRGFFGTASQSVVLYQIEAAHFDDENRPAPALRHDFRTADLLDVMTATPPILEPSSGEEKPGLWVSAKNELFRIPKEGRIERVDLDVVPRRLAQTSHGPVFMVDRGDHLRIEQRTVLRAPRYVLELPRLPWPSVLIARGDFLWISVGPAVLRTRL